MSDEIQFIDPQTGLSSRTRFDLIFDFAFSLGFRGVPLTLLVLAPDIGTSAESSADVMLEIGRGLKGVTRQTDVIARLSENEYVGLLVDCNLSGGMVAADRLRAALGEVTASLGVTLSAGVAAYDEQMNGRGDLIEAARSALSAARAAGGDRSEFPPVT